MKVFISYGSAADQVTALRLQALAAVNGLTVYVPPVYTRNNSVDFLDPDASQKLHESDVILGVISAGLTEACRQEVNTGLALKKSTIVMASLALADKLHPYFDANLVVIDPFNPDRTEQEIVRHLKNVDAQPSAKEALLALGTLALGLLIFTPASAD
jgi:hypothetical protein